MVMFTNRSSAATATTLQRDRQSWMTALVVLSVFSVLMAAPGMAEAQNIILPWDTSSCKLAKAFTGPWLGWMAVVAIAIAGLSFGIGELKAPLQTAMRIAAGFSIAVAAAAVAGWITPSVSASLQSFAC